MAENHKTNITELTTKQKLFVKEYLIDFNGAQAAIRAGYSKKTAKQIATENLAKPYLLQALQKEVDSKVKGIDELSQRIVDELKKVAFADIKDYLHFNKDGVSFHDSDEVDGTTISEVSSAETRTKEKDKQETVRVNLKLKLHDKMKALELLGRYKTLFTDKHEVEIKSFEDYLKAHDNNQKTGNDAN